MKKIILLLICFILISALPLMATKKIPLKIGTYENPPKIFTDENGEISGFWADITEEIANRENWEIQWVHGTWDQCLQRLKNNEIDIMVDVGLTPERQEKFTFSKETVLLSWVRIYKKNGSDIQTILDLEGKKIAGLMGSFDLNGPEGLKTITRKFKINCEIIEMENYNEIFQALENNQIDAGLVDKDFGNIHSINFNIEKTPIILQPAYMNFALTKKASLTPYLVERIDAQIRELKENNNSIYYHSIDKYLDGNGDIIFFPLWLKLVFVIIFSLTVIFFIFNNMLRHQVAKKTAQLQESEKQLIMFAENIPGFVSIYKIYPDGHRRYIYRGPGLENIVGKELARKISEEPDSYFDLIPEEDLLALNNASNTAMENNESLDFEYRLKIDDSHIIWVRVLFKLIPIENGVILCNGLVFDITERKNAEKELIKLSTAVTQSPSVITITDTDGILEYVNPKFTELTGYTLEEAVGQNPRILKSGEMPDNIYAELWKTISSGKEWRGEFHNKKKNGELFWEAATISPIFDKQGRIINFIKVAKDITERKLAEEQIKKDLKIKTALIQEIYHRTKNNMAVISAMLSIQARYSDSEYVKSSFREIRNKIKAMSLVHQKLYQAKDLSNINLKDYIKDLTSLIMQSYGSLSKKTKIKFDLHDVKVSIDSAVPLGLIINELISNIFKHAFPNNQEGEIFIRLFIEKNKTINLELCDNGVGFPENFNPCKNSSMGLASVFSIVENQLKGEISVKSENGLKWHIKIKDNLKKARI